VCKLTNIRRWQSIKAAILWGMMHGKEHEFLLIIYLFCFTVLKIMRNKMRIRANYPASQEHY
jgi:hypothetical protein